MELHTYGVFSQQMALTCTIIKTTKIHLFIYYTQACSIKRFQQKYEIRVNRCFVRCNTASEWNSDVQFSLQNAVHAYGLTSMKNGIHYFINFLLIFFYFREQIIPYNNSSIYFPTGDIVTGSLYLYIIKNNARLAIAALLCFDEMLN